MFSFTRLNSAITENDNAQCAFTREADTHKDVMDSLVAADNAADATQQEVFKVLNSISNAPSNFSELKKIQCRSFEKFETNYKLQAESNVKSVGAKGLFVAGGAIIATQTAKAALRLGAKETAKVAIAKGAVGFVGGVAAKKLAISWLGPIGWVVGAGSAIYTGYKIDDENRLLAIKIESDTVEVITERGKLSDLNEKMRTLLSQLQNLNERLGNENFAKYANADYNGLSKNDKCALGILVRSTGKLYDLRREIREAA
jgi:hypothetical protein